jgi:hypothetical protein
MPDKDKMRLEPYPTTTTVDDTDYLWVQNSDGTDCKITGADLKAYMAGLIMSDDTSPELGGDLDLNGFAIDFPTTPNISDCLDEDNMASNSATKLATQQSIKAYADTKVATAAVTLVGAGFFVDEDNMVSDSNAKVPSQQSVKAYVDSFVDQSVKTASSPAFTSAALTTPVINGQTYSVATGTITALQVLALNGTPQTVIAAPAASKAIVVDEIQLFLDYGAATYVADAGEDLTVEYSGGTDIAVIDNDAVTFLCATSDAHWLGKNFALYDASVAGTGDGVLLSGFDAEAVQISIASGNVITGDSELKYRITYHVVDYLV